MKSKRSILLLSSVFALSALTGCNKKDGFTVCLASEPQSIDPALNSAVDGASLLVHLDSGLYRYYKTESGSLDLQYDLAKEIKKETKEVEDVELTPVTEGEGEKKKTVDYKAETVKYPNGTRYTVTLKDNIKWSNGDKITADDFIYSWNRASSATLAADYGYMFDPICGAVAHETCDKSMGEGKYQGAATISGLNKVNDTTFTIDLMVDVPYFNQLLAFPNYFPVHKKTVEAADTGKESGTWARDPKTFVSCGAYKLDSWKHNSQIKLVKNTDYWDAANVQCEKITFALSDNDNAILSSYQKGQYDFIDSVPNDQIDSLKEKYPNEFTVAGQMGTYYISFNMNSTKWEGKTEEQKAKIRWALSYLIDRAYIVKEIGKAGQVPADGFVSSGISDVETKEGKKIDWTESSSRGTDGKFFDATKVNKEKAFELLKEAGYEIKDNKVVNFPKFTYLYNESTGHKAIAENIRDTLSAVGITMELESKEWATFLDMRKEGQYDVARNGWIADYDDPSSYLTMWTTASGNNDCQFGKGNHKNVTGYTLDLSDIDGYEKLTGTWADTYDKAVDFSNKETDASKRFKILHKVENFLMATGAITPIYYYTDIYMKKTNVEGFFSSPLGYKFFHHVTIKTEQK